MAARAGQEGLGALGAAAAVVVAAVDQEGVAAEAVIDNYFVVMVQTVILSKKASNDRIQTTLSHLLAAHSPCFRSADPALSPFFSISFSCSVSSFQKFFLFFVTSLPAVR